MGIVIRTLFNNQDWKAACVKPGDDPACLPCFTSQVNIKPPKQGDEVCSGDCWEQDICTKYRWGCTPQGRTFSQAYKGMKVFLVHKQFMGGYTIWGTTKVAAIDVTPIHNGVEGEDGYAFIHFDRFDPLPRERQVAGLSDKAIVGEMWRQGRFRYIDNEREQYLEQLISGENFSALLTESEKFELLTVRLRPAVIKRIGQMAQMEGRTIEEIVREAIAEWLRTRGK